MAVLLKLYVSPIIFGHLHETLEKDDNPFRLEERTQVGSGVEVSRPNFAELKMGDRKFDGTYIEIAVELRDTVEWHSEEDRFGGRPVPREMLDRFLDFVEYFPQGTSAQPTGPDKRAILANLEAIKRDALCIKGLHPDVTTVRTAEATERAVEHIRKLLDLIKA